MDVPRDAWLACVLAFEQLESGLRPFVQYIIEGDFIASALSLAAASELSALPRPWVWSRPYPSTTKVFPKSYGTWMKTDAVVQGWKSVLFGGAGTVGLHRLGAPSQVPWHNADEQKFADIVADAAKQRAAAWELAKMLVGSLDSDRAAAKAKTGAEGFAVDGLMLLIRFCKVFEDSVLPLQAAGVLDDGGQLAEAGRARNHTFHPSGATAPGESNFQLTQAEKEERIGKLEAVLGLVDSWEGLPPDCKSAIAAAKAQMAEMKTSGYATPSYDRRRVYEMYLQTAAQIADLKAEAGAAKDEVASLANGVAMLCAALPDDWREIAEGPLRKLGLDQLPERLDTLQAQLERALATRLQVMEEKVEQTLAVAERTDAGVAALRAAAAAEQQSSQVQDELALKRSLLELDAQRSTLKAKEVEALALAVKAGHVRLEDLGSASPTARRLSMQPLLAALPSIGGGGGAGATLPAASSSAGPSSSSSQSGGSTASSVMTITMEGSLEGPPPFDRENFKEKLASKLDMTPEQLKVKTVSRGGRRQHEVQASPGLSICVDVDTEGYLRYESSSSEDGSEASDLSAAETVIQSAIKLALKPRRIALDAIEVLWTAEGSIIVCVKLDLPYALKLMDLYLRGDSSLKDELRVVGVGLVTASPDGAAAQPDEESMRQFDELVRRVLFAPDHFAALGVVRSATEREIVRAYRSVMRELHPDRQVSAAQAADQPSDADGAALLQQAREGTSLAAEGAAPAAEQPSTLACGVAPLASEDASLAAEGASLAAELAAPSLAAELAAPSGNRAAEPAALSGARPAEPAVLDPDAALQRASAAAEAARAALEEAVASSQRLGARAALNRLTEAAGTKGVLRDPARREAYVVQLQLQQPAIEYATCGELWVKDAMEELRLRRGAEEAEAAKAAAAARKRKADEPSPSASKKAKVGGKEREEESPAAPAAAEVDLSWLKLLPFGRLKPLCEEKGLPTSGDSEALARRLRESGGLGVPQLEALCELVFVDKQGSAAEIAQRIGDRLRRIGARLTADPSDREFVLAAVQEAYPSVSPSWADRAVVLAAVQQSGEALQFASEELRADREIVLAAVKQDGWALEYASKELRADREIVLAAVSQHGFALEYASEKLRADREIVLAAVQQDGDALEYASEELWADREVMLAAVKQNGQKLLYASQELKADREIVLAAVQQSGWALRHASQELKADREVMLAAVQQSGEALKYASQELRADREVVLAAVQRKGDVLLHASQELRADREIVLTAVQQSGQALQYASWSSELRADREVVLTAVQQSGRALQYASWSSELRADREVVLAAVQQFGDALEYASQELRADREVVLAAMQQEPHAMQFASRECVLAAVQQSGMALRYASQALKADREVVLAAVKQEGWALQFVSEEFQADREIVLAAAQQDGDVLRFASWELRADRECMLAAVQRNGRALHYASQELRADREVVLAAVKQWGEALQCASKELRADRVVVLAAMQQNGNALRFGLVEL